MVNTVVQDSPSSLEELLVKIRHGSGCDFREYRQGTIVRRLARRLHASGTGTYEEYGRYLDRYPGEYPRLLEDLTIQVSSFFRNRRAYQQLAERALPELCHRANRSGRELRFWSAACAWGEEPYSIAIVVREFLRRHRLNIDFTVFATDISEGALRRAATGTYAGEVIVPSVPVPLRQEYFSPEGACYRIREEIRQRVRFARHDLTAPEALPYRDIDCIFCCNVLIYWQKPLQERVLGRLYDSLAAPGYLVLGEVETLPGCLSDRLECPDNKARIYRKTPD